VSDELVELMRTLRETEGLSIEDIAERVHLPWGTVNKICYYQRRVERRARVKMVRE
jgi:DNA-directed RNA polymerase specialized sigma24 family protein